MSSRPWCRLKKAQKCSSAGRSRRSRPTILSRLAHTSRSGSLAKRAAASRGKREVTVTVAPGGGGGDGGGGGGVGGGGGGGGDIIGGGGRTGSEQLEGGEVSDLDPATRHERNTTAQVRSLFLVTFLPVKCGAGGAELEVEVVQRPKPRLAGVALARLANVWPLLSSIGVGNCTSSAGLTVSVSVATSLATSAIATTSISGVRSKSTVVAGAQCEARRWCDECGSVANERQLL